MYIQSQIHAENRRIGEKQQKICETKGIKKILSLLPSCVLLSFSSKWANTKISVNKREIGFMYVATKLSNTHISLCVVVMLQWIAGHVNFKTSGVVRCHRWFENLQHFDFTAKFKFTIFHSQLYNIFLLKTKQNLNISVQNVALANSIGKYLKICV